VSPSRLEVSRAGLHETLEPRIMQVLVALYQADGKVVSRDELIARCWEGRVVGEDAITRAIGRLRRLSETDDGASFVIETIPKIGFRLVAAANGSQSPALGLSEPAPSGDQLFEKPGVTELSPRGLLRRRQLAIGAGLVVAGAAAGVAGWSLIRRAPTPAPAVPVLPKVAALVARAMETLGDPSPASMMRAIALCHQAVEQAPRYADGWGCMAVGYAFISHEAPSTAKAMNLRAVAAIDRALEIDPRNAYAWAAKSRLPPQHAWLEREQVYRQGLAFHPNDYLLVFGLAGTRANTGRIHEAADLVSRAVTAAPQLTPDLASLQIYLLWAANRLMEADKAAAEAIGILPRNFTAWISWVYLLIYTGRCDNALAALADRDARPPGVPDTDFDDMIAVAIAVNSGLKADTDRAAGRLMAAAHRGAGYATRGMQFLSALGRVDDAFAVAEATYFNRGFTAGPFLYSPIMARYSPLDERRTYYLFSPATKSMRRDPRFPKLVDELGLVRYWKESGSRPDYQLSKNI
ncbi:MAG TPA: winged helix-turn-helix domain-containing protein, partial [Rhizomicrobium sp.]|nr:winged helix-turn-helix domain-containing protein [Rhizomicrobium sp.]